MSRRFRGRRPVGLGLIVASLVAIVVPSPAIASSPGTALWISRYHPEGTEEEPYGVAEALSPNGSVLYIAGSVSPGSGETYGVVAINTAHGGTLWSSPFEGTGIIDGRPFALTLNPSGSRVFVTGFINGPTGQDFGTVAYDALTGAELWRATYDGSGQSDIAYSVAVSPDGSRLYVTGESRAGGDGPDYATVAYVASSGHELWVKRYNGKGNYFDIARSVVVSPDGSRVFVTGISAQGETNNDYLTMAYDAATGKRRWLATFNGDGNVNDGAFAATTSSDGRTLFVTGSSWWSYGAEWENTIAYNANTGVQRWARRHMNATAAAIALSPDGSEVFVAGSSDVGSNAVYGTFAYNASTGSTLWASTYEGPDANPDRASSLAVSPDGSRVYVTGTSWAATTGYDYATVAYVSGTGAEAWAARYAGERITSADVADSVLVSRDGTRAYVTGSSRRAFRTLAYST